MLTAGVAAAGTGLSVAAFAQTRVHMPGSLTPGTDPVGGGNQIRTPVDVPGACGNATDAVGNQTSQCWGRAATGNGIAGHVLASGDAVQSWEGRAVAEPAGSTISGPGSRCVCTRGPDAETPFPSFIQDARPEVPDRFGAYDPPAGGRPGGPQGLTGPTARGDRPGGQPGPAVQPWRVSQAPWQVNQAWQASQPSQGDLVTQPFLVNQSGQVNQIVPGTENGRFIQAWQESRTRQSDTSGTTGLGTQLARLPLVASLPRLAGLAGLGAAVGLSRLATAHGAGMLPRAALVLLAGAFAVILAGHRRRVARGARRGAMT